MTDSAMGWMSENSGSNYPAFKFANIGDTASGKIVAWKVVNTTDMNTQQPTKTLVIELEGNDGEVGSLWVKAGWMSSAIRDAVSKADCTDLTVGGTLAVKYTANGEQKKAGFNPPKIYEAGYKPPTPTPASASVNDLLN